MDIQNIDITSKLLMVNANHLQSLITNINRAIFDSFISLILSS